MPLACEDAEHLDLAEDVGEEQSGRGVGQLAQLPPRGLHILLAHSLDTGSQEVQGVTEVQKMKEVQEVGKVQEVLSDKNLHQLLNGFENRCL